MKKRKIIISYILSITLSLFIIIGTSFIIKNNLSLIYKHVMLSILSFVIIAKISYLIIIKIYNKLDNEISFKKNSTNKFIKLFNTHPFLISLIVIIAGWLIYIIAFYPCIMSPDPSFQILQYFGIDNKYSTYVNLIDENVILTNHHPIVHTLLIGSSLKIGLSLFNSTNVGLFIYSIIQVTILASTLSYTIKFMKEIKLSIKYRLICLIIYAFLPVFAFYAMSPVKDVIFGCLIILYIISIYKFIKTKDKLTIKYIIKEIILLILITLFRNNGFHIIILSFPFLLLIGRKNIFKYTTIILIVITFQLSFNNIILPYFKITPGSIRETLSIPFQQTARYVKEHKNEVTKKEKNVIDKVLGYDDLADRYKPEIADPVKNDFNKDSTKNDLNNYFKTWLKQLKKHPITYVEATINNTYGYFYPAKTNWYIYTKYNPTINEYGFNYNFNNLNTLRDILSSFGKIFPYIPIIGLIVNIGFSTWIILFMLSYLIYKKKYKELIYLIPSLIVLLVCVASPVNTYFRYALPNIFALPTMFGIFQKEVRKEVKK